MIAAAKRGFQAVGYELNPWLVWYSRYRAWRDGVHQNTKFYISDLWKVGSELCKNGSGMIQRFYKFGNTFLKKLKCCLTTRCCTGLCAKYLCWESGFFGLSILFCCFWAWFKSFLYQQRLLEQAWAWWIMWEGFFLAVGVFVFRGVHRRAAWHWVEELCR